MASPTSDTLHLAAAAARCRSSGPKRLRSLFSASVMFLRQELAADSGLAERLGQSWARKQDSKLPQQTLPASHKVICGRKQEGNIWLDVKLPQGVLGPDSNM